MSFLGKHFSLFKDRFDNCQAEGSSKVVVKLADIDPTLFDLVVLIVTFGSIEPSFVPGASMSDKITILIQVIFVAERLGSKDTAEAVVSKLRKMLAEGRRVARDDLTVKHIELAYKLSKGHSLRKLVVEAAVKPHLEWRQLSSQGPANPYDTADGEQLNEAQRGFGGIRFMYKTPFDKISDFKFEVSSSS